MLEALFRETAVAGKSVLMFTGTLDLFCVLVNLSFCALKYVDKNSTVHCERRGIVHEYLTVK